MFTIYDEHDHHLRGFRLTFSNGYAVSVINGRGSYSDGRMTEPVKTIGDERLQEYTNMAEVAVFAPDGSYVFEDSVEGWCDADRVAAIITEYSQKEVN